MSINIKVLNSFAFLVLFSLSAYAEMEMNTVETVTIVGSQEDVAGSATVLSNEYSGDTMLMVGSLNATPYRLTTQSPAHLASASISCLQFLASATGMYGWLCCTIFTAIVTLSSICWCTLASGLEGALNPCKPSLSPWATRNEFFLCLSMMLSLRLFTMRFVRIIPFTTLPNLERG